MINDDIRYKLRHQLEDVKKLMLSDRQNSILNKASDGITACDLSQDLKISIQNASQALAKLHKAGYLDRVNQGHPTGGSEYVYKTRI